MNRTPMKRNSNEEKLKHHFDMKNPCCLTDIYKTFYSVQLCLLCLAKSGERLLFIAKRKNTGEFSPIDKYNKIYIKTPYLYN